VAVDFFLLGGHCARWCAQDMHHRVEENGMRPDRVVARLALALTIIIAGCHAVAAAELAIPPRVVPQEIPKEIPKEIPEGVSVQTGPPYCSRWTDECVNCTRGAKGESAVCSNIGLVCQPKAIRCLDAQ
jgi:hypothetical protein